MRKIIALVDRARYRVVVTNTSEHHQRSLAACAKLAIPKPLTTVGRCLNTLKLHHDVFYLRV